VPRARRPRRMTHPGDTGDKNFLWRNRIELIVLIIFVKRTMCWIASVQEIL
jgi:hypothetical protein